MRATRRTDCRKDPPDPMDISQIVSAGPLLLAAPLALAAGAITFLSPCCLPLVPGYLSYVTGMSGAEGRTQTRGGALRARTVVDRKSVV